MSVYDLPPVNAVLNGISTLFIILGFILIKKGRPNAHRAAMFTALVSSAAFLTCYLVYHFNAGSVKFTHAGPVKTVYHALLLTHILLAVVNLPMIIITVLAAARKNWTKHRRWAKVTLPVWLYVSITGVLVYLLLYQWYPAEEVLRRRAEAGHP